MHTHTRAQEKVRAREDEVYRQVAPQIPPLVTTIVMILSFLIATSVFFEVTKDYVEVSGWLVLGVGL